jgi:nucleotide-binding universal stress UspA family protein
MSSISRNETQAKILVPLSNFIDKNRLFRALQILSTKNPLIVLFRVVEVPRRTTPLDPAIWKEDIKTAGEFLDGPASWLKREGYSVETKVVTSRDTADGIVLEANNGGYSLVLLTKRRIRSGWGAIFHKSISEEVVRYANPLVLSFLAEPELGERKPK